MSIMDNLMKTKKKKVRRQQCASCPGNEGAHDRIDYDNRQDAKITKRTKTRKMMTCTTMKTTTTVKTIVKIVAMKGILLTLMAKMKM